MNPQIIAVANQKGGVGKTTTCANLGIGLAQAGKKVLLMDADPQASLTISLGNPQPDKLPFTLSDAMGRILMDEPLHSGEGILHHPEGVDLMPADIQLSGMEVSLVNAMSRETILRQYLDTVKGQYSHILIDCQPSLGMLTVNALAAANRIIVPVQAEYLPAKGLEQLESPYRLTTLEQFREFPANTECFVLEPNISKVEDVGWRYLAQHLDVLLPSELLDAIDPVPFGNHAMREEQGCFTSRGYLTLSGDEWEHERPRERQTEKKPSIKERLEQSRKECAHQSKAQPHREKPAPER